MAIYRGPGGAGDATNDATSQSILAAQAAQAAAASEANAASSAISAAASAALAQTFEPENFATAAQGALADSAIQPEDLGSAAYVSTSTFATAAQGSKADTALQPSSIGSIVQAYDADLTTLASGNVGSQLVSYGQNGVGFKNRIINGGALIWQRGTTGSGNNAYVSADRWYVYATGSNITLSQGSVITSGNGWSSLQVTGASGNTVATIGQKIESYNCVSFVNSEGIVAFDAIASTNMTLTVTVNYANAQDVFSSVTQIATQNYSLTTSAQRLTLAVPANANNWQGLRVEFSVSSLGAGANFRIGGVQLEQGSTATPFDYRPYGTELALCQRYYTTFLIKQYMYSAAEDGWFNTYVLPQTMRASPTFVSPDAWTSINVSTTQHSTVPSSYTLTVTPNTAGMCGFVAGNATATLSAEL